MSQQSIQKNNSSLLDLPAVINPSAPSGEAEVREVRRAPVGSFLDLPATSRPSRYTKPTGPTTFTHRRSFTQTVRGRVVGLFRRSLEKDHFHSQLSPHTIDPFTSGSTHGPIDNLPKRPQRTRQPTWIAESRTRPIFAFETGPLPDEIERGCFYHLASYICFGQRDPNINPVENVVREIAPLTQSEPGPAQTKSRLLEALNQLLVMLRLRRPPPAPVNTPSSNITRSVFASDGVNNGAPVPTFIPAPHQSSRPAIATPPPTDVTAAQLHAPASVSTSAQALSPSAQVLASTDDTHASVTLTPAITCVAADIELQSRPTIIVTDDQLQNYPAVAATSGPSLSTADTYLTPAIVVSPDEMAILQEYRRQKSKFAVATGVADVSSNPSSHHDTRIYPGPSTSKSASLIVASGTPQPWQLPSSPGFPLNLDAQGPRPLLLESNFTHSLSSPPSPASSPALQTFTINEVGPGNLMKPIDNAPADTTPESPHVQPISSYLDQPISSYLDQPAVDQAFADVFQLEEENPWQDA
ncbi:hypothetical protein BS17DRAFT_422936 [Gyrodon lividus]|nr:hypothetical protein BS17DRAFT_422936 [Gyrodon lividus]